MTKFDLQKILRSDLTRLTRMYELEPYQKLSTPEIGCLINLLVEVIPYSACYLNIGTGAGYSLVAGAAWNSDKMCIGVDNWSEMQESKYLHDKIWRYKNIRFYEMDYKEYFKLHMLPIGLYYYDADHSAEATCEGLSLAVPFMYEGSQILIDDWNWEMVRDGAFEFLKVNPEFSIIYEEFTEVPIEDTSEKMHRLCEMYNGICIMRRN